MHRVLKHATLAAAIAVIAASASVASAASSTSTAALQQQIEANNAEVAKLNQEIASYQAQLTKIGADKKTLQQAINALDLRRKTVEAKISATQRTINTTQLRIDQLGTGISKTEQDIATEQGALGKALRDLQLTDSQPFVIQLLSSEGMSAMWDDVEVLSQIDGAIQNNVKTLQQKQSELASNKQAAQVQQNALVQQRGTLRSQNTSLVQTKQQKKQLLVETNSKESTYQKLLAEAQAELASFSKFSENAGGSGLLANQTTCDSWGCYYNQRDAAWGNDALNGTKYALKSDGCLVTAMAMVLTHYGFRDVTPVTINSNPANFAAYYPAYLLFTIHVDGKTIARIRATIDKTLATGNPLIVGLHAYGGTHFVVLVSGRNGNYVMRDPYVPNGDDIDFSSHYKLSEIYSIQKVSIS